MKNTEITPDIVASHGFTPEEYERVLASLGRVPNITELGIFSVMWSEHCSYKSSRFHLRKLPTKAQRSEFGVICGPGENAGIIDIGDGDAAIFKMESHNHPSYIEPYQGAATGVGGILRDVFTMGARPIANLNALRFGDPQHPKMRHLISGVVSGIGGYGNCVGVPTVGGEVTFHPAYNGNILVNAMTVGLARTDKIFYSAAAGLGNPVVYVGSKTGRDGIHGATMSSTEFTAETESKRPTVQVGDPFTEKLLIEACLELMASDAIVAIQDMGAAGLTSSSVEMASKGGVGIELNLNAVPQRETGMSAYEMMLSESQERMLMILKPGREDFAQTIFHKWGLDFAIIGTITDTEHLVLKFNNEIVCDIPLAPIGDNAPLYERPFVLTPKPAALDMASVPECNDIGAALIKLMGCPDLASRRWIWEQYDHTVMADTIQRPGGDAAVVRVHGTKKALAMSTDCTPRYCFADPFEGGKQAVAECWRNITSVGALPLAITDCMNFASPLRPEIMGQFVGCITGMAQACTALDFPVVSGNVSLYNESKSSPDAKGQGVLPTPAIGGVGLLIDADKMMTLGFKAPDEFIYVVGDMEGHLGQSLYLREIEGREDGAPPPVNLLEERRNGDFIRIAIDLGAVTAVHDISDGGLLIAIAEMALAANIGATLTSPSPLEGEGRGGGARYYFGEDQARYIVTTTTPDALIQGERATGTPVRLIGKTSAEPVISIDSGTRVNIADIRKAHEGFFAELMG
jgi:phosphoribosylformylglycinamidine synthase subunit PurL